MERIASMFNKGLIRETHKAMQASYDKHHSTRYPGLEGASMGFIFLRHLFVRHWCGLVVWAGFVLAVTLTAWGMWQMAIAPDYKAFLMVCWLFLLSTAFTLAKMLRDAYEDQLAERGLLRQDLT